MITLDQLPPHMINALLTREDQSFYEHHGFTLKSIGRAFVGKLTGRSLGGGSTITQQLAGTLYLDRSEISLTRKIKELWWSLQLERRYSKREILELYLNKMYFGGGTYGVNAASKFYFGHPATEITPAESAILVIQLSNPGFYNPFEHPNRARDRQQEVLSQMVKLGYLNKKKRRRLIQRLLGAFRLYPYGDVRLAHPRRQGPLVLGVRPASARKHDLRHDGHLHGRIYRAYDA